MIQFNIFEIYTLISYEFLFSNFIFYFTLLCKIVLFIIIQKHLWNTYPSILVELIRFISHEFKKNSQHIFLDDTFCIKRKLELNFKTRNLTNALWILFIFYLRCIEQEVHICHQTIKYSSFLCCLHLAS